jgi:hypothetical protein
VQGDGDIALTAPLSLDKWNEVTDQPAEYLMNKKTHNIHKHREAESSYMTL